MPKAVIYIRVSTGPQVEGTSLSSQLAACRAKAAQIGATVVQVYEDVQSGADYRDRQQMQLALDDLEAGRADTLIVFNMSRYSRDLEHQQNMIKRIKRAGARLVFCNREVGDLNDPSESLIFGVEGVFSNHERVEIRARTVRGRNNRAKENVQPCRSYHPYGYHIPTKEDVLSGLYTREQIGHYVVIEEEAAWVRQIFQRYADGQTIYMLSKWLTFEGPPSPRHGTEWHGSTIARLMRNPVYKGQAAYGRGRRQVDESRIDRGLRKVTHLRQPQSQWTYIDAPALVTPELWQACQDRLTSNRFALSGQIADKWMLTGILRCPLCGSAMNPRFRGSGHPNAAWRRASAPKVARLAGFVYRCRNSYTSIVPANRCPGVSVRALQADQTVIEEVLRYVAQPHLLETYWVNRHKAARKAMKRVDPDSLQRQLGALQRREAATIEAQIRSIEAGVDSSLYEQRLESLCTERDALQAQLAAAGVSEVSCSVEIARDKAAILVDVMADVRDALTAPSSVVGQGVKRELLLKLIDYIVPHNKEGTDLSIAFADPLTMRPTVASIQMLASDEQILPRLLGPQIDEDGE